MQRDASHGLTRFFSVPRRSRPPLLGHNSALPEASWYWSSDLDLCSSGKNFAPDGESKSFAIPSLGVSCRHFLSYCFLKMLFLVPQQPCLSVSNILEVSISSSYKNRISHPVLNVQLTENEFYDNASEQRPIRWMKII
jgi:hypothetical protein